MDFSNSNRGYCFVTYTNKEDAKRAIVEMNNYEIRPGQRLGVCASVDNCRLFVGGIPKEKTKAEILSEIELVTVGVKDVIVYTDIYDKSKNRGFAFVEYNTHRDAAMARRKLVPGRIKLFGCTIAVDWAEPEREVSDDVMLMVKVLYVRNLLSGTTEETLRNVFDVAVGRTGSVKQIKKIRDYAFIHFENRHDAEKALAVVNGVIILLFINYC
ncbi:hypothetical protein HELRODRAFT_89884 [Helobdella robusta]|uniref:RRM domain-containing protein n=1 Tax=Helobdella robusta TaxID=6412 RepID=T1G7I7_HELRO|nr:hypothetical protein HELRODRAFT_89884 [Helobdella robusta]ESN92124.1 hypothetical protein HELRODRAFT_89884 [Helobdella robusta]